MDISPFGSSMPSAATPLVSQIPTLVAPLLSQTVYVISCSQMHDVQTMVEIINDNAFGILDLFTDVIKVGKDES